MVKLVRPTSSRRQLLVAAAALAGVVLLIWKASSPPQRNYPYSTGVFFTVEVRGRAGDIFEAFEATPEVCQPPALPALARRGSGEPRLACPPHALVHHPCLKCLHESWVQINGTKVKQELLNEPVPDVSRRGGRCVGGAVSQRVPFVSQWSSPRLGWVAGVLPWVA